MDNYRSIEHEADHDAWLSFVHNNERSLQHIHKSQAEEREYLQKRPDSEVIDETLNSFFTCLTQASQTGDVPLDKDIRSIKKIMDAVMEAQKDETLTEKEALELVRFTVSKFVERRISRALSRMMPLGETKQWFYRSSKIFR